MSEDTAAGKRLLVADHEPGVREDLVSYFQGLGYLVEPAATAQEALSLIPHHRPDLVILDVEMPDQDGFLVCAKVKRFSQKRVGQIPIILCSMRLSERDRHFGRYAGADDYILKPFDYADLARHVQWLLERPPLPPE